MSYADRWTDKELIALEKKIHSIYSDAQKDFEKQSKDYFAKFAERDEEKRKKVESGEITKNEYTQWRMAQMGRGERLDHMARQMAERATKANEVAVAYVNDKTPGIYTLNRNHEAYVIEGLGHEMVGADFSLYNEQAVRRLVVEDPNLMPYYPEKKAVARGIDLDYGQKYIKRHVLGGIIQGKSVYKIADDLQRDVADMNRASAIRTARTAVTAAQNGGRQATMNFAKAMGIKLRKRWVAAKDGRTRDVHGKADGQTVQTDEPFVVGGELLMFPGDRTSASGWNIYNCRCGMRTVEKEGIEAEPRQIRVRNPETGRNELVNEMTYTEWAESRGLSSEKKLTSSNDGVKINLKNSSLKPYKKIKVEDIPPMDKERYGKMKRNLERQGVAVIQDAEGDRYLRQMSAEAITLSDGSAIIFQSHRTPSASAVFEEVIHVTQIRKRGSLDTYGDKSSTLEYLNREIEAGEKLLKHSKSYGLTKQDIASVEENVAFYYSQLEG